MWRNLTTSPYTNSRGQRSPHSQDVSFLVVPWRGAFAELGGRGSRAW